MREKEMRFVADDKNCNDTRRDYIQASMMISG